MNSRDVQDAGGENPDSSIRGPETFLFDEAPEAGLKAAQEDDLGAAQVRRVSGCVQAPDRFEGVANGTDAGGPGGAQDRAQDPGKHVHVLMGVDVSETQAGALQ